MGIFSAVFAGMLFVLLSGSATPAFAASAENDSVRVRCDESGIIIRAEGEDFVILAPRRDEHFQAEVLVQPLGDWELVRPTTNPFNMKGGDAQGYEAKLEPEDERSGTIFFHNYCVRSDWGDGEKDVVVPAGTTVVFTASKNGEPAPSDWTVDGVLVETNKTSYTFNAPVSEPRFLSVRPFSSPYEGLKSESYVANDSTESALEDSGSAQESGIIRISGPNSKFSEQTERSAAWAESEVIYSQPCAQFSLTAILAPDMSDDEREIILNNINWSADQGTLVPDNANPLEALHTAPAATGEYHITVSCGTSKRVILVKVAVPEIHQVSFSGNIAILRDVAQSVYPAPDWMDANMDGTSDLADANANTNKSYHPIAYLSTDKLSATGVFRPKCTKVSNTNEWIAAFDAEAAVQKLRIALDGGSWSSPVDFNMDGTPVMAASPFRSAPEVVYEEEKRLLWSIGFGSEAASDAALTWHQSASQHEFYLTYKAKVSSFETVFHRSCLYANGATTDVDVVEGVWSGFTGLDVCRKDGTPLTYYKSYLTENVYAGQLLKDTDGQCASWSELLKLSIEIQGLSTKEIKVSPVKSLLANGFIVKTWVFASQGHSGLADYPFVNLCPSVGSYVSNRNSRKFVTISPFEE